MNAIVANEEHVWIKKFEGKKDNFLKTKTILSPQTMPFWWGSNPFALAIAPTHVLKDLGAIWLNSYKSNAEFLRKKRVSKKNFR